MKLGFVLPVAMIVTASPAQLIVGNDQTGVRSIYHVDVTSGVATALFTSTSPLSMVQGMAYDKSSNRLWWTNGAGRLYSSTFSMSGLTPVYHGAITRGSQPINFTGLGFRNGMLIGTRQSSLEAVYTINTNTLVAQSGYVYNAAYQFGGIDVDSTTNLLYGVSDTAPSGQRRGLYHIDDSAMATSMIAPYPYQILDIDGLAVHGGLAYGVTAGVASQSMSFYVWDVNTGMLTGTLPSPFTGAGAQSGAAILPAPGTLGLVGLLGATGVRRKRRLR
jgi:hypothetical protein